MPNQEEEKASGKPAAKARPILKPSSTSGWDFTPMEERQWIDIEIQESKDSHCFRMSEFTSRLLGVHYDQVIECKKMLSDNTGYRSDEMMQQFANVQYWSIDRWISVMTKSGGQKKRFQYCLNPNYLHRFLYLRAIQGHSGSTINPALQDNVMLPEGFTEYIYHVGNGKIESIVNHGLIPGGVSLKTDRQSVFFTVVNPIYHQDDIGKTLCDLSQARIASWKILGNNFRIQYFGVIWRSLNKEDCNFIKQDQTQLFSTTLPAEFIEKAICMKTKDQLCRRESVILLPRAVLNASSEWNSQDLLAQEARSSWESQQDTESYGEIRSNTADYRVPGISISTVKLQDARRQNNVTQLIEMPEKHQRKEQFLEVMSQKQEINKFSEESQQLLADMNQTEIFEHCENSAKHQCPDCNAFFEFGIIYCSCGWNLK